MNRVVAKVVSLTGKGAINQLELISSGEKFKILTLKLPSKIVVGSEVVLMFKESEVAIAIGNVGVISISNKIKGKIKEIKEGEIVTLLTLSTEIAIDLYSLITTSSVKTMNLKVGDDVFALVKANEISLELK